MRPQHRRAARSPAPKSWYSRAKEQNRRKGRALVLAINAEIAAVYFLAVAVAAILLD